MRNTGSGAARRRVGLGRRDSDLQATAVRAALLSRTEAYAPRPSRSFLTWLLGRFLAAAILMAAARVVYDCASSDRYLVHSVRLSGNVLLSQGDIERAAEVSGANVFWLDHAAVEARVKAALPQAQQVQVAMGLPGTVDVRVSERTPDALWMSGETTYLVDREGVVVAPLDETCVSAGCEAERRRPMTQITDPDGQSLTAGARIEVRAIAATRSVDARLPGLGLQPVQHDWTTSTGLEILTEQGIAVRFDVAAPLEPQLAALATVRGHLTEARRTASLIDVRFPERPYFR